MSKIKNKPGIHLIKKRSGVTELGVNTYHFYWHIVSRNGRIIARSSETYTRKVGAVKSIRAIARMFCFQAQDNGFPGYYDHSKPDSPLQSYL
jgi:hypothetical protein